MKNIHKYKVSGLAIALVIVALSFGTMAFASAGVGVTTKVNLESEDSNTSVNASANATVSCSDNQYSCPCATGNYCLMRGAMCLSPNSACPTTASTTVHATSTEKDDNVADDTNNGSEGDEHQSRVASIVASLLLDANRDGGIGDDVRLVVNEQASTSVKVKQDMDEINGESSLKVFLIGTNYKNTGDLRSSIVTTQNNIDRLKKAEDRATNATVKADLAAQISALQLNASTTASFVATHEDKFSLFGWLVHIFVK